MRIGVVAPRDTSDQCRAAIDLLDAGLASLWFDSLDKPAKASLPTPTACYFGGEVVAFCEAVDAAILIGPCEAAIALLKDKGKPTVAVHAAEFICADPWWRNASAVWALSPGQAEQIRSIDQQANIIGGRWGVNVDSIEFTLRDECREIVSLCGDGGIVDRKGLGLSRKLGVNEGRGDVLLSLNQWETYPYPIFDCMARGMPVLCDRRTANYWGINPLVTIDSKPSWLSLGGHRVESVYYDVEHLASVLNSIRGCDLAGPSQAARDLVSQCHDLKEIAADMRRAIERLIPKI